MNINDCLSQIVALTRQNLELLTALNESFYTRKEHIAVQIEGQSFAIPSFLSLESKIDSLQQNLDNLLDAPKTGEAFTYFDGTTQKMELSGYASTPTHVDLGAVTQFGVETNNVFKDFMSPNPYVRLDIRSIPNNIKHVNIKKIAIKNTELKSLLDALIGDEVQGGASSLVSYSDVYKLLYNYLSGEDYVEYNTVRRLPIRETNAYGVYTIRSIEDTYQDSNLDEHYELVLEEDLTYTISNGTISRDIKVGDVLITNDDKTQMIIESVVPGTKHLKVRILYGGYANLYDSTTANSDRCKLKFYKSPSWDQTKYIDVPIEEDRYVCIFAAIINDTTNIQSPWGTGLYIDTYKLEDGSGNTFDDYYKTYVNNIGDSLFAITRMMTDDSQIEKLSSSEFETLMKYKPTIDTSSNLIRVTQINKHLNDSKSVQRIRTLYNQKVEYKNQLNTIQDAIDTINATLATISFSDTSNTRVVYESQLEEYNTKRRELTASLQSIIGEISESANSSETPIENAKYRIRGFVDVSMSGINLSTPTDVIKLDVEYRYKNHSKFTGNAETIGDDYIYSDWNKMDSIQRYIQPKLSGTTITYSLEESGEARNQISFNQLDIPISQGEVVDIRVRYVYNLGYPFVRFTSDWSPIVTIEFPEEFLTNVEVLDILSENNDDIKKQQYIGTLNQYGLIDHAEDMIQDQTIKYFHQPEHISSGFYTSERRIIPLKDKLSEIVSSLSDLQSEVYGAVSDNLVLSISDNSSAVELKPNIVNTFRTISYDSNDNVFDKLLTTVIKQSPLLLNIYNAGDYTIKLHTLFPGDYHVELSESTANSKYDVNDYITGTGGVYMLFDNTIRNLVEGETGDILEYIDKQRLNQFVYFRTRVGGANALYSNSAPDYVRDDELQSNIKLSNHSMHDNTKAVAEYGVYNLEGDSESNDRFAYLYPYPGLLSSICATSKDAFVTIDPGNSIKIPLNFVYWFKKSNNSGSNAESIRDFTRSVTRSIAFDIRTSLFADPVSYKLNVSANYIDVSSFKTKKQADLSGLSKYSLTPNTDNVRILANPSNISSSVKRYKKS